MVNPRYLAAASLALALVACTPMPPSTSPSAPAAVLKEIAPTGKLRLGVVVTPAPGGTFAVKDSSGQPKGPPVTLGQALAQELGVPLEIVELPNSGELTDRLVAGALDVGFLPVDEARRQKLAFGPVYSEYDSAFLARPGAGLNDLPDVDRNGVRVAALSGTATLRALEGMLKHASLVRVNSVDEAMSALASSRADALALGRGSLAPLAAKLPGSHILKTGFRRASVAPAVARNRPLAQEYLTAYMQRAKQSGLVRRAFDEAGLAELPVTP